MPFISESIDEVVKTLFAAVILVFLVMFLFLFLQNWRAPLIPTIVVRIALLGACLGLAAFGFAINLLSLFAVEQLLLSLRRQKFDNLAAL
jgi:multidrug efflux pump